MKNRKVVSREEWEAGRLAFLEEEKRLTRAQDELNARRRRLPLTRVRSDYFFNDGTVPFVDLFEGRPQLIVYHNMLAPDSDDICPGCSYYCDQVGNLEHLHARRTTFAVVSRATLAQIQRVKGRLGWTFPWYSSHGSTFYEDFVRDDYFGLSVFLREGEAIYQSYFTTGRGVEHPCNAFGFLDITPWGRQETWEDSPPGTPQEPAHSWVRLHDEYDRGR